MPPHYKHPTESISPQLTVTKRIFCRGFTLVELMVVIVILSILASLSLAGLNVGRQRSKIEKTKSTIRKLHEIVMPQYESYLNRRVGIPFGLDDRTKIAKARLTGVRLLAVCEMPDQWNDVYPTVSGSAPSGSTAPVMRYQEMKASMNPTKIFEGAECLSLIVLRGGFTPDVLEGFRTDEIGDIDSDGIPEFLDGWNRPISFIRWPAGFSSPFQSLNATTDPDPLDPMKISGDYALVPLIFSYGPDGASSSPTDDTTGSGLVSSGSSVPDGWISILPITSTRQSPLAGSLLLGSAGSDAGDNITNHDLIKK